MNNSLERHSSKFEITRERISKLEDILIKIIQPVKQRKKESGKMNRLSEESATPLSTPKYT